MIHFMGRVSKSESISAQKRAVLLLLLTWNNPIAEGTVTGKLFEYIAASRPILAIAYPGVIKEVLEGNSMGKVINNSDEIQLFLRSAIADWKSGDMSLGGYNSNEKMRQKFSWDHQASKLNSIFEIK